MMLEVVQHTLATQGLDYLDHQVSHVYLMAGVEHNHPASVSIYTQSAHPVRYIFTQKIITLKGLIQCLILISVQL